MLCDIRSSQHPRQQSARVTAAARTELVAELCQVLGVVLHGALRQEARAADTRPVWRDDPQLQLLGRRMQHERHEPARHARGRGWMREADSGRNQRPSVTFRQAQRAMSLATNAVYATGAAQLLSVHTPGTTEGTAKFFDPPVTLYGVQEQHRMSIRCLAAADGVGQAPPIRKGDSVPGARQVTRNGVTGWHCAAHGAVC